MAIIALGTSAFFLFQAEQQINARSAALRAFDARAREAARTLADIRAGEQAYVAAGQGIGFWMPKVASLLDTARAAVDDLRVTAASGEARAALMEGAASITEFGSLDKRARDYVTSSQPLMAADVVFTEGEETAASAARQVEAATVAEHQAFDAFEAGKRRFELYALSGAAGLSALVLMLLAVVPNASTPADEERKESPSSSGANDLSLREAKWPPQRRREDGILSAIERLRMPAPALKLAAELCTEFGRIRDVNELTALLARAAEAMDASGLIVWVGSSAGADLRPTITHGYPPQSLSRMPPIPRSADNAVAAAYRTGLLQVVAGTDGAAGAIVSPLLSSDGCIGALTAEVRGGAEISDAIQSLATIISAQLSGMLAASVAAEPAGADVRAANS